MRTPSWDFSDHTLSIIEQVGLSYDSSLMADDEPYELLADGRRTGIVEIPVEWIRDDAPYLMMERYGGLRPYMPPRGLLEIWRDEFDAARAEGGLFQLTLHPHIIGHRSRLVVLRDLLAHITGHSGVWFATHAQVADLAREQIWRDIAVRRRPTEVPTHYGPIVERAARHGIAVPGIERLVTQIGELEAGGAMAERRIADLAGALR